VEFRAARRRTVAVLRPFISPPTPSVDVGGERRLPVQGRRGERDRGSNRGACVSALRNARATLRSVICERVKRYAAIPVIP